MIYFEKKAQPELQVKLDAAKSGNRENVYRSDVVYEQVKKDFCEKCYLCEDDEMTSIQIEHFNPHQGDMDLKYTWNNLFYSCGHCNNLKGNHFWPLLDCTKKADKVWESIEIKFTAFPKAKVEVVVHPQVGAEQKCANTKAFLDKSLCGLDTTAMKKDEAEIIRKKMLRNYNQLMIGINANDDIQIKASIADNAAFAGAMRWVLKNEYPSIYKKVI